MPLSVVRPVHRLTAASKNTNHCALCPPGLHCALKKVFGAVVFEFGTLPYTWTYLCWVCRWTGQSDCSKIQFRAGINDEHGVGLRQQGGGGGGGETVATIEGGPLDVPTLPLPAPDQPTVRIDV